LLQLTHAPAGDAEGIGGCPPYLDET